MRDFTFYADLVSVSSIYATSPDFAYKKLDQYYNVIFTGLSSYYEKNDTRMVDMYSDSLVVTGDDFHEFLTTLAPVYMTLLSQGLLLRGGIVEGYLDFDVRITKQNFKKKLPLSGLLAQCVALERSVKGSRIIISKDIALPYFNNTEEWLTLHGYALNPHIGNYDLLLQRSIIPMSEGTAFEMLYPVMANVVDSIIKERISEMDYMIDVHRKELSEHYSETKRILSHSLLRLAHQKCSR